MDMLKQAIRQSISVIAMASMLASPMAVMAQEQPPAETVPAETVPVETAPVETVPVETAPVETVPVEPTQPPVPVVCDEALAAMQSAPSDAVEQSYSLSGVLVYYYAPDKLCVLVTKTPTTALKGNVNKHVIVTLLEDPSLKQDRKEVEPEGLVFGSKVGVKGTHKGGMELKSATVVASLTKFVVNATVVEFVPPVDASKSKGTLLVKVKNANKTLKSYVDKGVLSVNLPMNVKVRAGNTAVDPSTLKPNDVVKITGVIRDNKAEAKQVQKEGETKKKLKQKGKTKVQKGMKKVKDKQKEMSGEEEQPPAETPPAETPPAQ